MCLEKEELSSSPALFGKKKPLITLMQAFHACAARRCLRYAQTCCRSRFGAAKIFSKAKSNAKAAAKQVVSVSERQRRVAQPLGCICVICGFPHVSRAGNTHNKSIQEQSRTLCRLSINFAGLYRFISQITAVWRICILWTEKISEI